MLVLKEVFLNPIYLQKNIIDGFNLYSYVTNNPVNFLDPLGTCKSGAKWFKGEIEARKDEVIDFNILDDYKMVYSFYQNISFNF